MTCRNLPPLIGTTYEALWCVTCESEPPHNKMAPEFTMDGVVGSGISWSGLRDNTVDVWHNQLIAEIKVVNLMCVCVCAHIQMYMENMCIAH